MYWANERITSEINNNNAESTILEDTYSVLSDILIITELLYL